MREQDRISIKPKYPLNLQSLELEDPLNLQSLELEDPLNLQSLELEDSLNLQSLEPNDLLIWQSLESEDPSPNIFSLIMDENIKDLKEAIARDPGVLDQISQQGVTPIFFAIDNEKLDALKAIIETDTRTLEMKDPRLLTPIFSAIIDDNLEALKAIIQAYPASLEHRDMNGFTPIFSTISDDNLEALKIMIKFNPDLLNKENEDHLIPIIHAIKNNYLDAVKAIIQAHPASLEHRDMYGLTPIFSAILENNLDALKIIIQEYPASLEYRDINGLSPIFSAILKNNLDALKIIIQEYPASLEHRDINGLSPIFYAIHANNLDGLKAIIQEYPASLGHQDINGLTPIFYAIHEANFDILRTIIQEYPASLEKKDRNGNNPLIYAIQVEKFEALKIIVENAPKLLDQADRYKSFPIDNIIEYYDKNPSEENKKTLKFFFKKQFERDLEDEELVNIIDFTRSFDLLKLAYNDYGQYSSHAGFKKIISSFIPKTDNEQDALTKNLTAIYQKIGQEKIPPITFIDKDKKKNNFHIYDSNIKSHSSYFVFHVDDKNQLTSISYCDGNQVFQEQQINNTRYINGTTTLELKEPIAFSDEFAKKFIRENSENKNFLEFYKKDFLEGKLKGEKIWGIDFSKITYSIPTKKQQRDNCTYKSSNILARFLLEQQAQEKIFDFDLKESKPIGAGYESYKKIKAKITENALETFKEKIPKIAKDFLSKTNVSEIFNHLSLRSSSKKEPATKIPTSPIEAIAGALAPSKKRPREG